MTVSVGGPHKADKVCGETGSLTPYAIVFIRCEPAINGSWVILTSQGRDAEYGEVEIFRVPGEYDRSDRPLESILSKQDNTNVIIRKMEQSEE